MQINGKHAESEWYLQIWVIIQNTFGGEVYGNQLPMPIIHQSSREEEECEVSNRFAILVEYLMQIFTDAVSQPETVGKIGTEDAYMRELAV